MSEVRIIADTRNAKQHWERRGNPIPYLMVPMSDGSTIRFNAEIPQPAFQKAIQNIKKHGNRIRKEGRNMRALYDIDQDILACVDQDTGEILDTEKLDALQMEREAKLEGVALWVKDLKAEAAAVKEEADKLTARRQALDNKITALKSWLLIALDGGKLKTPRCNVYQTHSQRVAVADEPALINFLQTLEEPEKFLRFKDPELKKDEIKKALKDGTIIPGAELEETESVVIK